MKSTLQFLDEHFSPLCVIVLVLICFALLPWSVEMERVVLNSWNQPIISASAYEGQNPGVFGNGWGPSNLLTSSPVEGCSTVDQAGLHVQDIPTGESFVYSTTAYGGFCGAEMLLRRSTDVEIIVAKQIAWAAVYDIKVNGRKISTGVVFSYGDSILAETETATSDGAMYTATPISVWVFTLPSTDPVDQTTAELALPQTFPGTAWYYPVIQKVGDYGVPQYASVLDAVMRNSPMK